MKTSRAFLLPAAACLLAIACTGHKDPAPEPAECPPPRQGGICAEVVVWAKDPQTGACCQYGRPCDAPEGWETFYSEAECRSD